jgi:hypothetical protein
VNGRLVVGVSVVNGFYNDQREEQSDQEEFDGHFKECKELVLVRWRCMLCQSPCNKPHKRPGPPTPALVHPKSSIMATSSRKASLGVQGEKSLDRCISCARHRGLSIVVAVSEQLVSDL